MLFFLKIKRSHDTLDVFHIQASTSVEALEKLLRDNKRDFFNIIAEIDYEQEIECCKKKILRGARDQNPDNPYWECIRNNTLSEDELIEMMRRAHPWMDSWIELDRLILSSQEMQRISDPFEMIPHIVYIMEEHFQIGDVWWDPPPGKGKKYIFKLLPNHYTDDWDIIQATDVYMTRGDTPEEAAMILMTGFERDPFMGYVLYEVNLIKDNPELERLKSEIFERVKIDYPDASSWDEMNVEYDSKDVNPYRDVIPEMISHIVPNMIERGALFELKEIIE